MFDSKLREKMDDADNANLAMLSTTVQEIIKMCEGMLDGAPPVGHPRQMPSEKHAAILLQVLTPNLEALNSDIARLALPDVKTEAADQSAMIIGE